MLTDVKSGNGINLAAEATGINARISSAKSGLAVAAKALETLRNDGLSGLYIHAGAALGNMIGVGQFANAWEGQLEDGTRLHGSARWMDGVLGVVNIGLTVYPGTSAIKNGITAAMAAKTMVNGMGKTTWKKFVSATATAYCKITVGECFVGDTIVITGTRPQTSMAAADASGIDGWEWIVSATGLVLVSRLARRRSKQDDELPHTETPRLEWSPQNPNDPDATPRPSGRPGGLPQWAPLDCDAHTKIGLDKYRPKTSHESNSPTSTPAESIDDPEIEPVYHCHEELAAALEAALQADMLGAQPTLRKAHFPAKPIASHSKVVELSARAISPDAKTVRTRQRSSIAWSVVSAISLVMAACCFTNGLPFLSSLWQGEAQAETAIGKPTEELIGVKIRDLRPGQRVLARVPGTDSILPDTEINPADWRLITLLMPKPGGDRIDIQLLRSLGWIEDSGAADGETIELDLEELGAAGPALVVSIQPCPPIEPDDGQGRRVITGTFQHSSANILALRIAGEPEPIRTTGYHPFWSEDRQEYVPAKTLTTGERLLTASGTATSVMAINRQSRTEPVYNLEIDVDHVYHVGTSGVLVHNSCPKAMAIINRQHGLTPHDDAINAVYRSLRDERKGNWRFRKNQALIDTNNNLISYLRPDLQWTDRVGNRHVLQVVGSNPVTHAQIFRDLGFIYHEIILPKLKQ